jgi:hypothetical protein
MSNCDLTPVPSCTVDPCVIGTPAPVASICPSSNLADPQARLLALEQKNRALTSNIRELQRLYNLLLTNTSAGSTTLQGQITALEIAMAATEAATAANAADILTNAAAITANGVLITANSGLIATNALDIATNAGDIATIEANLLDDTLVEAYVSAAAASAAITSGVYLNALANATIASGGFGSNFTVDDTNKRLTYTGAATKEFLVTGTLSFISSVSTEVARFRFAKGGVTDAQTEISRKIGTGSDVGALALQGVFSLATNEYIELWATLDTSIVETITVNEATLTIIDLQTGI